MRPDSSSRPTARGRCAGSRRTPVALYDTLEVDGERCWYGVGGIEVATTPERMEELKRRQGYARSYGIEGTELLSPAEAAERSPLLDPSTILGALLGPERRRRQGGPDRRRRSRGRREAAGVAFEGGVTVTGFDIRDGPGARGRDRPGRVECERVLLCAGFWGPTRRRDGGRADPARRRAAPAGVDRPDARARRVEATRGRPPGPAPSGHVAVLPAPRRSLRRRQLPP